MESTVTWLPLSGNGQGQKNIIILGQAKDIEFYLELEKIDILRNIKKNITADLFHVKAVRNISGHCNLKDFFFNGGEFVENLAVLKRVHTSESLVFLFITHPINFCAISLATLRHVLDSYHAITPV